MRKCQSRRGMWVLFVTLSVPVPPTPTPAPFCTLVVSGCVKNTIKVQLLVCAFYRKLVEVDNEYGDKGGDDDDKDDVYDGNVGGDNGNDTNNDDCVHSDHNIGYKTVE